MSKRRGDRYRWGWLLVLVGVALVGLASRWPWTLLPATPSGPDEALRALDAVAIVAGPLLVGWLARETISRAAALLAAAVAVTVAGLFGPRPPASLNVGLASDLGIAALAILSIAIWKIARPAGASHRARLTVLGVSWLALVPVLFFISLAGPGGRAAALGAALVPLAWLFTAGLVRLARRLGRPLRAPVHSLLGWLTFGAVLVTVLAAIAR